MYGNYKRKILHTDMQQRLAELGIVFKPSKDETIKEFIVHYHKTNISLVRTQAPKQVTTKVYPVQHDRSFDDELTDLEDFEFCD